jgi:hypothetical protein
MSRAYAEVSELMNLSNSQEFLAWRQFSTTPAVQLRRDPKSQIRVPSKKALAAKQKRKAAIAQKEDDKAEKLPLLDAIQVLRVRCLAYVIPTRLTPDLGRRSDLSVGSI